MGKRLVERCERRDYLLEANRRGRIENVKINRRPLDLKMEV